MRISAIAAMTRNRVIGKDNDIPWNLPTDMKYFMRTTTGHHILMGRKNYESLGKPLPRRTNVVITRNPYFISTGCIVVHSIPEALRVAYENGEEEAFIIGGGEIYKQAMPVTERLYLTEIEAEIEGDVFFPEFDRSEWRMVKDEFHPADQRNEYAFRIRVFDRVSGLKKLATNP